MGASESVPERAGRVGGPVRPGWRESTLTRAKEIETLTAWAAAHNQPEWNGPLAASIAEHLAAARDAARSVALDPRRWFCLFRNGALHERAMTNLDAAEANLLNLAPAGYLLGQMPSVLCHVRSHLVSNDPRRLEMDRIGRRIGLAEQSSMTHETPTPVERMVAIVDAERATIVAATRAAASAKMREFARLRNFRNTLVYATASMSLIAIGIAVVGLVAPTLIPLCFAPQDGGQAMVVCPIGQSERFAVPTPASGLDIDDYVRMTVTSRDLLIVELIGLVAAAVSAAAAIRGIRGSSERLGVPTVLALLKLPTGAITAFLGLLLMRGQFVPGLSALDTSAQILAWALVFGYAQQLFTRLVDQQGQQVLDSVRGADKATPALTPQ